MIQLNTTNILYFNCDQIANFSDIQSVHNSVKLYTVQVRNPDRMQNKVSNSPPNFYILNISLPNYGFDMDMDGHVSIYISVYNNVN